MGGTTVADLIVEDDRDGVEGGQLGDDLEILVRAPWAAVEHDERPDARLEITRDFVPSLARLACSGHLKWCLTFDEVGKRHLLGSKSSVNFKDSA